MLSACPTRPERFLAEMGAEVLLSGDMCKASGAWHALFRGLGGVSCVFCLCVLCLKHIFICSLCFTIEKIKEQVVPSFWLWFLLLH